MTTNRWGSRPRWYGGCLPYNPTNPQEYAVRITLFHPAVYRRLPPAPAWSMEGGCGRSPLQTLAKIDGRKPIPVAPVIANDRWPDTASPSLQPASRCLRLAQCRPRNGPPAAPRARTACFCAAAARHVACVLEFSSVIHLNHEPSFRESQRGRRGRGSKARSQQVDAVRRPPPCAAQSGRLRRLRLGLRLRHNASTSAPTTEAVVLAASRGKQERHTLPAPLPGDWRVAFE
jgi:hypothetical protein